MLAWLSLLIRNEELNNSGIFWVKTLCISVERVTFVAGQRLLK